MSLRVLSIRLTFVDYRGQVSFTHFIQHLTVIEADICFINVWCWQQQLWAEAGTINNSEIEKNLESLPVNGKENSYIFYGSQVKESLAY
jgi:hypothetical protein